jgi:hypothetical protein
MNNLPAYPELHPSMRMTRAQKLARAGDKRRLVMDFLGSGEVYSTISVLARLISWDKTLQRSMPLFVVPTRFRLSQSKK